MMFHCCLRSFNALALFRHLGNVHEILAVLVFNHGLGQSLHLFLVNPLVVHRNFFEASHLLALSFLNYFDERTCFAKAVVCARVTVVISNSPLALGLMFLATSTTALG